MTTMTSSAKPRRIFRKHHLGLVKTSLHLSKPDMHGIEQARQAYAAKTGMSLSSSLLVSLGIAALVAETACGNIRRNPEMVVSKP